MDRPGYRLTMTPSCRASTGAASPATLLRLPCYQRGNVAGSSTARQEAP